MRAIGCLTRIVGYAAAGLFVVVTAGWAVLAIYYSNLSGAPFTRADFLTELNWMTNTYFPQRSTNVLNQYRAQLLYPNALGVPAPTFNQAGGDVARGFNLTMSASKGTIYYTTNGADPRVYGTGATNAGARRYTGTALTPNSTVQVQARAVNGTTWSPLTEQPSR